MHPSGCTGASAGSGLRSLPPGRSGKGSAGNGTSGALALAVGVQRGLWLMHPGSGLLLLWMASALLVMPRAQRRLRPNISLHGVGAMQDGILRVGTTLPALGLIGFGDVQAGGLPPGDVAVRGGARLAKGCKLEWDRHAGATAPSQLWQNSPPARRAANAARSSLLSDMVSAKIFRTQNHTPLGKCVQPWCKGHGQLDKWNAGKRNVEIVAPTEYTQHKHGHEVSS